MEKFTDLQAVVDQWMDGFTTADEFRRNFILCLLEFESEEELMILATAVKG